MDIFFEHLLAGTGHYVLTMLLTVSFVAQKFVHPVTTIVDRLTGYQFSMCRLCVGFWVSLGFWGFTGLNPLYVLGISQFLTMLERE